MGEDTGISSKARKKREKKTRTKDRMVQHQTPEEQSKGVEGAVAEGEVQPAEAGGGSAICLKA